MGEAGGAGGGGTSPGIHREPPLHGGAQSQFSGRFGMCCSQYPFGPGMFDTRGPLSKSRFREVQEEFPHPFFQGCLAGNIPPARIPLLLREHFWMSGSIFGSQGEIPHLRAISGSQGQFPDLRDISGSQGLFPDPVSKFWEPFLDLRDISGSQGPFQDLGDDFQVSGPIRGSRGGSGCSLQVPFPQGDISSLAEIG